MILIKYCTQHSNSSDDIYFMGTDGKSGRIKVISVALERVALVLLQLLSKELYTVHVFNFFFRNVLVALFICSVSAPEKYTLVPPAWIIKRTLSSIFIISLTYKLKRSGPKILPCGTLGVKGCN